ncbi:MAG: hypothetical protein H6738_25865 [Alphaproteobacteria bacterium]|nr:hypothetical protein [Alphaproteobacteria bacterium]
MRPHLWMAVAGASLLGGWLQGSGCGSGWECPKSIDPVYPPTGRYVVTSDDDPELAKAWVEIRNDGGARSVQIHYVDDEVGPNVVVYDMD